MIVQVQPLDATREAATREVRVNTATESGYVLVVEDDDGICDVISTILTDAGYEAVCVQSAERALRLVEGRRPGLVLLDLSVAGPHLDDLIAAYRRDASGRAPIVVMSGHPRARETAAAISADAVLEKPFDILVLLDTVEAAFER
jgi:DNA-binding response OmpR family regulator